VDFAALRALPEEELVRRNDELARDDVGDAARPTIFVDELRARVAEQQTRELVRALYALLLLVGLLLGVAVATLIVVA
jgi:hypothetical protein